MNKDDKNDEMPGVTLKIVGIFAKVPTDKDENAPKTYSSMPRRKVPDHQTVTLVPGAGVVLPNGIVAPMWHTDPAQHQQDNRSLLEERAVLLQAVEHYHALADHATLGPLVKIDRAPCFGEQLLVQGANATQLCIGDVFEGDDGVQIEISSPRLPCASIDQRNGAPYGKTGLKEYCKTQSLAGWFVRVKAKGKVQTGTRLRRVSHPHPAWTLAKVSHNLYGQGTARQQLLGQASWSQSNTAELQALCNLPQLGWCEWKEEAVKLLQEERKKTANNKKERLLLLLPGGVALVLALLIASILRRD